jgi:hypothetical protein
VRDDLAAPLDHAFDMDRPLEPRMPRIRDDHGITAGT